MNDRIKTGIDKTQRFVRKHPTLTACAVSALAASKITHKITVDRLTPQVAAFVYEAGLDNSHLLMQNRIMLDFINQKNLGDELYDHILSLKE